MGYDVDVIEYRRTNRCSQAAGRPSPDVNFTCRRWLNGGVRPLNRIAEDGDLIVGNPRVPIPTLARCVMGRHDVHS